MNKKAIVILLVILIVLAFLWVYIFHWPGGNRRGWDRMNELEVDQWRGYYNNKKTECYLNEWQWDGNTEKMELTIPEEIAGAKVVALGGFEFGYASKFYIEMPEAYQIPNRYDTAWVTESEEIADDYPDDYPTYRFNVKLNSQLTNLRDCEDILYYSTEDGKAIAYKVEIIFE